MPNNGLHPPDLVNLHRLRVFLEVVNRLSFSRAALRLSITQPAISEHIRQLEQSIGGPLFKQRKHNLALTPEGLALHDYALRIIALVDQAEAKLRGHRSELAGPAAVGYYTHPGAFFPDILFDFQLSHQKTTLTLLGGTSPNIAQMVLENRVGLGFVCWDLKDPEFETIAVGDDDSEAVVIAPLAHPVGKLSIAAPQLLTQYPFVHFPSSWPYWVRYFRQLRIKPNYVTELDSMEGIERAVERGLGISLVAGSVVNPEMRRRFSIVPFTGPTLRGPIFALRSKRRYSTPVEEAVLEYVLARFKGSSSAQLSPSAIQARGEASA